MALRDTLFRMRDSVSQMTQRFLHGDNQGYGPQGYGQQPDGGYDPNQAAYGQESAPYASPYENAYQQQAYQQAGYQQQTYQQAAYQQQAQQQAAPQQAQQQPYQAYPQEDYASQGEYQSPYAGSFYQQTQPQQRQSRAAAHSAEKVVPFPGMVSDRAGNAYAHEAQIVQLRDRDECRAIIEHLKNNCTVALNMDNIASDTEKQRCVDMLSGAAYTLSCNICRISTRGVYLITPAAVRVTQDDATRRLNGLNRPAAQKPGRAHSYAAANRGGQNPGEAFETQESGYAQYPPQAEYPYQEASAPQGYQNPYGNEGEYRTAGYYAQEPRHAAGYGR